MFFDYFSIFKLSPWNQAYFIHISFSNFWYIAEQWKELLSIQNIITGQAPAQTLDTKGKLKIHFWSFSIFLVLESFNAFKPVEKAVILIVPELTGQYLSGEVAAPSIEVFLIFF